MWINTNRTFTIDGGNPYVGPGVGPFAPPGVAPGLAPYQYPYASAPYHYPNYPYAPPNPVDPSLKVMETKLDGLRNRNKIMAEKIDEIKENRAMKAKQKEIDQLEVDFQIHFHSN